jgi:diguanylate cyclase (GGDEF)-like protein
MIVYRRDRIPGKENSQLTSPIDCRSSDLPLFKQTWRPAHIAGCSRFRSAFAILLLIVGFAAVRPALASDLVGPRNLLEDASGTLNIANVAGVVSAQTAAESLDHRRDLVMMFFVTAMFFLLLWAIFNYFQDRQPEVGLFAIYQAVYTAFGIAATGYLALFSHGGFPQLVGWAGAILYFAINVTTLLFCRELFRVYEPPRILMRGINLLLYTSPVLIVVYALGFKSFAISSNAVLIQITWLALAATTIAFRVEDIPRRWIVQAFFVAVCLSNAAFGLATRNSSFASTLNLSEIQLLFVNGLTVFALFVVILKARALHAQRTARQAFLDLLRVQKKFEIEKELKKQAEFRAQTDFLTGVFNRRSFAESGERELDRAIRFQRPLSLLMFDIDHFKVINDTWGHAVGDIVLQKVSHLIHEEMRGADIFGRIGGEEFAAILVEAEGNHAFNAAQRLCASVADAVIAPPGAERIPVTISIGLAQLNGRNISFDALLNEADQAMYAAKEAGRNRVSGSM